MVAFIYFIIIYKIEVICATSFNPGLKSLITDYRYEIINITVAEYSTVNLFCNNSNISGDVGVYNATLATSSNISDVQWYLNSTNGLEEIVLNGKILQIRNVTRDCSLGTYVCIKGSYVTEIQILTEFPPYVDILIPVEDDKVDFSISTGSKPGDPHEQIKTEDGGIYVLEKSFNEKVTLICEIQSSPHISTSWIILDQWLVNYTNTEIEKNTKHPLYYILRSDPVLTRSNTDRYKFELEIEFNIKDGHEFGYWTCRSENELGTDQWKIKIQQK